MTSRSHLLALLLLVAAPGCTGATSTDSGASPSDAAVGADVGLDVGMCSDTGAGSCGQPFEAGTGDAGSLDGGVDAATLGDAAAGPDTGVCPTPPTDLTPIDTDCHASGTCAAGFTCQSMSGVVLQQTCQLLCDPTGCPCPAGLVCNPRSDKLGTWNQCEPS